MMITRWIDSIVPSLPTVETSRLYLVFLAFSFLGWVCEVAYVGIFFEHKFVNRGFLTGPVCPIYGVCGILILLLPQPLHGSWVMLFFSGMILCSVVEYAVSAAMERMFHAKWWDYSDKKIRIAGREIPLHINGRVCLQNSLLFGVMTVIVIRIVQPLLWKLLSKAEDLYLQLAAGILAAAFIADIVVSVRRLVDFSVYMARLKDMGDFLRERYEREPWFRGGDLAESLASIRERAAAGNEKISRAVLEKIENLDRHRRHAESFLHRFPTMKSAAYPEALALFRRRLKDSVAQKKAARRGGRK